MHWPLHLRVLPLQPGLRVVRRRLADRARRLPARRRLRALPTPPDVGALARGVATRPVALPRSASGREAPPRSLLALHRLPGLPVPRPQQLLALAGGRRVRAALPAPYGGRALPAVRRGLLRGRSQRRVLPGVQVQRERGQVRPSERALPLYHQGHRRRPLREMRQGQPLLRRPGQGLLLLCVWNNLVSRDSLVLIFPPSLSLFLQTSWRSTINSLSTCQRWTTAILPPSTSRTPRPGWTSTLTSRSTAPCQQRYIRRMKREKK